MLVFRRYWQKLIAYSDKIGESVILDRFLRLICALVVILFCVDGAFLVVRREVFLDLIRADVPSVCYQ